MNPPQFSAGKIGILSFFLVGLLVIWSIGRPVHSKESVRHAATYNPEITGPDELCLIFGAVIGTFEGGGDPSTDVYYWQITDPSGTVILERSGGSQFQRLQFSFQSTGIYQIGLRVRRNADFIFEGQKALTVRTGPSLVVRPDYLICGENPTEISAMDPSDPTLDQYQFKWNDSDGNLIGTSNSIQINQEGQYFFEITSPTGGCFINGNTYAGPNLDFEIQVSNPIICSGSDINLSTDTPLSGEWSLIKPGSTSRESLGTAFQIQISKEELTQAGIYSVIFSASDPRNPGCQSTRRASFEVNDAPILEINVLENPDNCGFPNGSIQLQNFIQLDSLIIEELGLAWIPAASGSTFTISELLPKLYTVVAVSESCRLTQLFNLEAKDPPVIDPDTPEIIQPNIMIQNESCGDNGVNSGVLTIEFPTGSKDGEYRILAEGLGEIQKGSILNQSTVTLNLPGGIYYLELTLDGCTYPMEPIAILKTPSVNFNTPSEILICEKFEFIPQTEEDLVFTLIAPDSSQQSLPSGSAFVLTQEGEYLLSGIAKNPNSGLCPKTERFTARLSQSFTYSAVLAEEDCFGNQIYEVEVNGIEKDEISIRWINEEGNIVGRGLQYFSSFTGNHTLEIQPLRGGFCPTTPYSFTIEPPVLSVDIEFETQKICPDPGSARILMKTSRDNAIDSIAWIYFDDQGNRQNLPQFSNQFEIETSIPGNYEVVTFNRIGCEVGRVFTQVELSSLLTFPELEEQYGICAKNRQGPILNPGNFATYRWFLEEDLLAETPTFMPGQVGNYTLEVTTEDGCLFSTFFSTVDLCYFEYQITDGMILNDSSRQFEAWVSESVTEAEIMIFNRLGELIHFERMMENPTVGPTFRWDGTVFGKKIIPGTYVVVLKVGNPTYRFTDKITQSLFVIE